MKSDINIYFLIHARPCKPAATASTHSFNFNSCILKDFPIHIDTISMGLHILYFKGSQDKIFKFWYMFIYMSEKMFLS